MSNRQHEFATLKHIAKLQQSKDDILLPPWENADLTNCKAIDINDSETVFSVAGAGPLVIAAPHGGNLLPATIPDRTSGCTETDENSAQLAWTVFKNARERLDTNRSPSLVVGKLHRRKVDLARARSSSAESDGGRASWDEYHSTIERFLDDAIVTFGHAHLVDVHGQCHREATEVGHMLTNSDLRKDCSLDPARSSISAMCNLPTFISIEDAVWGPYSIGTLLEDGGYAAVPSSRAPHPCCVDCECLHDKGKDDGKNCLAGDLNNCCRPCTAFDSRVSWRECPGGCDFGPCSFFWGANTLAMYGGGRKNKQLPKYRGVVSATQLETHWSGARESGDDVEKYGCAVADATVGFMEHFYSM